MTRPDARAADVAAFGALVEMFRERDAARAKAIELEQAYANRDPGVVQVDIQAQQRRAECLTARAVGMAAVIETYSGASRVTLMEKARERAAS